jgi:hypothetical protein
LSSHKNKTKTGDDNQDNSSDVSLSINVPIGGFVSERVALGIAPGYLFSRSKIIGVNYPGYNYLDEFESNLITIDAFCRYYGPVADRLKFLLIFEMGFGFGNSQYKNEYGYYSKSKLSTFNMGVAPGFSFKVKRGIYLEAMIGDFSYYNRVEKDEDATDESPREHFNNFSINFNSFTFGMMFLF